MILLEPLPIFQGCRQDKALVVTFFPVSDSVSDVLVDPVDETPARPTQGTAAHHVDIQLLDVPIPIRAVDAQILANNARHPRVRVLFAIVLEELGPGRHRIPHEHICRNVGGQRIFLRLAVAPHGDVPRPRLPSSLPQSPLPGPPPAAPGLPPGGRRPAVEAEPVEVCADGPPPATCTLRGRTRLPL
eukprot:CAMPEP_0115525836 /NCGR_PEP_ID=MMETSP0271-20121206/81965_1 /TAXON_ID=71861 /ORGANISM="Scrippsiella trochoidea, Strain CCMP3099" /LENGTH=186 /DNA_ID=CAMNT_0002957507 /DNA_START=144 /DNA_END=701 /DNA_ORIENTATION=-